jgi:Stress responsive A/B Barrel Domain
MIRHVVVIAWQAEASAEQKAQASAGLATLPRLMRGLLSYSFGPDVGVTQGNADFAIVADFADAESYIAYRDHHAHVEVIKTVIAPIARSRTAVQFEV